VRDESNTRVDAVAEAMEQMVLLSCSIYRIASSKMRISNVQDWSEETKASHGPYSHSRYGTSLCSMYCTSITSNQ